MQNYIRVVADSAADDKRDLLTTLSKLFTEIGGTSLAAELKPHTKGGFSVVLNHPEEQTQAIIEFLIANGWRPCF